MTSLPALLLCFPLVLLLHPSHAQNSHLDYLDAHNVARLRVGVPNITWDDTVAAYAQRYANARIGDCNLVHSHGPYGENLACGSGPFTSVDAVRLWLEEKPHYSYHSNCCEGGQCLHYTQVVWHSTKRIGCARVQCSNNGWWYVTCNYDPPGNYWGKRPY